MWIADGWKDYEVIDTSCGEKLERWGDYLLVRPDPQVICCLLYTSPVNVPGSDLLRCQRELYFIMVRVMD